MSYSAVCLAMAATVEEQAPAEAEAVACDSAQPVDAASEPKEVSCRRCRQMVSCNETIVAGRFREGLKHCCKPCHALTTQLQRHGISLKDALTEEDAVAFFLEAGAERQNSCDQRLSYTAVRSLLKQKMVETAQRIERNAEKGQWQPLSFWELKGYDSAAIEAKAERKTHEVLGEVFRVDIEHVSVERIRTLTEERLLEMESAAQQRHRQDAVSAALPLDAVLDAAASKKRKTPEEKAAAQALAKQQRLDVKRQQKAQTGACSAAAKYQSQLKTAAEKLKTAMAKAVQVTDQGVALPAASAEEVSTAQKSLDEAMAVCAKLLAAAAKGSLSAEISAEALPTDKKLQEVVRNANAGAKTLLAFVRSNKENAPKAKAKAKMTKNS